MATSMQGSTTKLERMAVSRWSWLSHQWCEPEGLKVSMVGAVELSSQEKFASTCSSRPLPV